MAARRRARSRPRKAARCVRNARGRTKPRAGTPAQNSARYAPNLESDRNQLIVVTLHRPDAPAEPFCRHARELCYSVTLPTIGPRCDSSGVLQKINIAKVRLPAGPTAKRATVQRTKRLEKLDPGQSASLDSRVT